MLYNITERLDLETGAERGNETYGNGVPTPPQAQCDRNTVACFPQSVFAIFVRYIMQNKACI